jgi:hypothetical protein
MPRSRETGGAFCWRMGMGVAEVGHLQSYAKASSRRPYRAMQRVSPRSSLVPGLLGPDRDSDTKLHAEKTLRSQSTELRAI